MAQVVLIHSALGLTDHVGDWAYMLRADGHHVVTPDLFGGRTFTDLDAAVEFVDAEGGPPAFLAQAVAQSARLKGRRVYAGFSLGGAVAEVMALTRDDAAGWSSCTEQCRPRGSASPNGRLVCAPNCTTRGTMRGSRPMRTRRSLSSPRRV